MSGSLHNKSLEKEIKASFAGIVWNSWLQTNDLETINP